MPESHKELVRRYFEEVINARELEACAQIVSEDYVEHAVAPFGRAEPGHVNGPVATRESLEWLIAQFPDIHMTIEALVSQGDTVVARVLSKGTNLGKLNGILPPTGKRFVARQSHWFRVENDKLAEHWATREDLPAMLQLGVVQPPGPSQSSADIDRWLQLYLTAWKTDAPDDIARLFTDDARYFTEPFRDAISGKDAIVAWWIEHGDSKTAWTFESKRIAREDGVYVVHGITGYPADEAKPAAASVYHNLWFVTLSDDGRASEFVEWWMLVR